MNLTAIIGGSGLTDIKQLENVRTEQALTPYGEPSADLVFGTLDGHEIVFLARHGENHQIPPHKVNYRANIWALKEAGARNIIAVAAVGGIHDATSPTRIVIPDQIIDYTYGREQTYFPGDEHCVNHVDFTWPYCESLRQIVIDAASKANVDFIEKATYAATQGPRLESAAEIKRLAQDGCDIVGMTGMPETVLARELEVCYACIAIVANYAAGKSPGIITMEDIGHNLSRGMQQMFSFLPAALQAL